MYTARNPEQLKDIILRRLGAPIINVELTDDMVYDCISRAIELYNEYHHDGMNKTYVAIKLTAEQANSGVVTFRQPLFAVSKIVYPSTLEDAFTPLGSGITPYFSDIFSQNLVNGKGAMLDYYLFNQYVETMETVLAPTYDFWYNAAAKQLRLYASDLVEGQTIVVEGWAPTAVMVDESATNIASAHSRVRIGDTGSNDPHEIWQDPGASLEATVIGATTPYAEQDVYNVRWVKDFSTALAKQMNATVLKKFPVQLPGGVTVDGAGMYQEATDEIEKLREELDAISEPLGVYWG